jgi:hypothetical protein
LNIVCLLCYLWVGSISCTCDYEYLYIDRHFFWGGMEMVLVVSYLLGLGLVHWGDFS